MTLPPIGPATPRMRASIKWGLTLTVAASAAAWLWPAPTLVGVRDDTEGVHAGGAASAASERATVASTRPVNGINVAHAQPLAELPAASTAPAFDPFVGLPIAPPAPGPSPAAVAQAPVAPAAKPPPPQQDYRFLGRMTGPDGTQQILLGRGDAAVSITKGMTLDNGYVVEAISVDAVTLAYPPLGVRTSISIPEE